MNIAHKFTYQLKTSLPECVLYEETSADDCRHGPGNRTMFILFDLIPGTGGRAGARQPASSFNYDLIPA